MLSKCTYGVPDDSLPVECAADAFLAPAGFVLGGEGVAICGVFRCVVDMECHHESAETVQARPQKKWLRFARPKFSGMASSCRKMKRPMGGMAKWLRFVRILFRAWRPSPSAACGAERRQTGRSAVHGRIGFVCLK